MSERYSLSVIIPVYNVEKYLSECIESILKQTLNGVEIILIDDGSPDNSGKICDEYALKYDNIRVVHKNNEGLGITRNCGINNANGEYIAFIDSDDVICNDYLEKLYGFATTSDSDVCYSGGFINFDRESKNIIKFNISDRMIVRGHDNLKQCMLRSISADVKTDDLLPGSACMSLYKRDFLNINNIRFISERSFISEDLWFNLDCLSKAKSVVYSDVIGYMYRYNESSLSRGYSKGRFQLLYSSIQQLINRCELLRLENYIGRVAMYYWVNLEKCINQEVRYNKSCFSGVKNIRYMCELEYSKKLLSVLDGTKFLSILHRLLCRLLVKKKYYVCVLLLKIYNFYKH